MDVDISVGIGQSVSDGDEKDPFGGIPPGYMVPLNVVKNYIRRMITESEVSCPFRFSKADRGSCLLTDADGNRTLVIGLKSLYERSEVRRIPFRQKVPDGLPDGGSDAGYKAERPVQWGNCRFVREDDAVWLIRTGKHELRYLEQELKMFVVDDETVSDDVARMAVDSMLSGVINEYYLGSYYVMLHEMDAERVGVVGGLSDLRVHAGDLGLEYSRCKMLLLDRIEREPQWYGEQFGPDVALGNKELVVDEAQERGWPGYPKVRDFGNIEAAVSFVSDYDRVRRCVNGLSNDIFHRSDSMWQDMGRAERRTVFMFADTQDEARAKLMNLMVLHGRIGRFDESHVAGFRFWPDAAKESYMARQAERQKDIHERRVRMARILYRDSTELREYNGKTPLVDGWFPGS